VQLGDMQPLPVYVFDERDNRFCKWPRFWFLREITENAAQYKGWEVVVGNASDYVYRIILILSNVLLKIRISTLVLIT